MKSDKWVASSLVISSSLDLPSLSFETMELKYLATMSAGTGFVPFSNESPQVARKVLPFRYGLFEEFLTLGCE